jgi:hypothetical protein
MKEKDIEEDLIQDQDSVQDQREEKLKVKNVIRKKL